MSVSTFYGVNLMGENQSINAAKLEIQGKVMSKRHKNYV